jgi:hypothetical protein
LALFFWGGTAVLVFFRILIGGWILVSFPAAFLIAFARAIDAPNAEYDGMMFGLASAMVWALSILGVGVWNNLFNGLAAFLIAISVGYVSGSEIVCKNPSDEWICYVATAVKHVISGLI